MSEKINTGAVDAMSTGEKDAAKDTKDKRVRNILIAIIIVLLLLGAGIFAFFKFFGAKEDPDIAIAKLINESVKAQAGDSYQGYRNAKAVGYVLDDLLLSNDDRAILWDSVNDCYLLFEGEKLIYSPVDDPAEGYDLWIFVNMVPATSAFSVYWAENYTVTKQVTENGVQVDKDFVYSEHQYKVTESVAGGSRTYTCTEDGCGYSYTVKNK